MGGDMPQNRVSRSRELSETDKRLVQLTADILGFPVERLLALQHEGPSSSTSHPAVSITVTNDDNSSQFQNSLVSMVHPAVSNIAGIINPSWTFSDDQTPLPDICRP
jgi:hypothetical protein